ncbi:unnamed protein product [Caenorhabditis angaria]|uniref:Uncharacterized protein n=1 Tax=Caenorhabditis angaria TaxID=860376 RepID=A0A9P1INA7_9PELO|nr:unnamed protein product [Caenorhabditis angaria]
MTSEEGLRHRKDSLSEDNDSEFDDHEMKAIVNDIEQDKINEVKVETRWGEVKSTLTEWGETASFHGIPHLAQAHTFTSIIVWATLLIFCGFGFFYMFTTILTQYLAFDVVVNLNSGLESSLFPSLTFCNTNPYKLSKMTAVPELYALLTVYQSASDGTLS